MYQGRQGCQLNGEVHDTNIKMFLLFSKSMCIFPVESFNYSFNDAPQLVKDAV
jgi:hypothetical protein